MKKNFLLTIYLLLFSLLIVHSQNKVTLPNLPEIYVTLELDHVNQVRELAYHFSIDHVLFNEETEKYDVRIWLAQQDFDNFLSFNIPFTIYYEESSDQKAISMAYTVDEMLGWNRYPTYSTYLALMDTFQKRYPTLCKIDTILASTPGNRMLLAAHISSTLHTPANKPNFFYTSTMHGDEVTGFYCMLRLIDYLLSNYATDQRVMRIVNSVNLWICPNENPDGTYRSGNNIIGSSPTSTRSNSNGVDLNRSYPHPLQSVQTLQPEVEAMMNFAAQHSFVMSANFHGGAELANYPWDAWTTNQQPHADDAWWQMITRNYVDSCQFYGGSNYLNQLNNGITNGGDWYVVYGSRQDYMNYYASCREVTVEISKQKTPATNNLPFYWNANKSSLLSYIEESLYGFRGLVFDAYTEAPLTAEIFVNNHDNMNSQIYTQLPLGNYHRPIKSGTYSVTFSADGYCPRTFTITTRDKATLLFHVALTPCDENGNIIPDTNHHYSLPYPLPFQEEEIEYIAHYSTIENMGQNDLTQYITSIDCQTFEDRFILFPNPTQNDCMLHSNAIEKYDNLSYQLVDIYGKIIKLSPISSSLTLIPMHALPAGIYLLFIRNKELLVDSLKIVKR